ncbi:amino acid transporter-like protein [Thelonectria olida]|uniref:Amino acid transporter-like protein n=1 Tax=Thelonectria olida TaxID=1576542 RepID=A0A9P9AI11_9HYPO|nr:amino acid transporter-like protein [Thelonectria olida]
MSSDQVESSLEESKDMAPPKLEKHVSCANTVHEGTMEEGSMRDNSDFLHRRLGQRQIQLIAIGGSIGTALFVLIGSALSYAGPLGMLLAYITYAIILGLVNSSMAEMVVYMPVSGSFIRMAAKWVDPALGVMMGYNFLLYQWSVIPFEITAINLVLKYWSDDIPVAAVCGVCMAAYFCLNVFAVKYYGEAEFWLAIGKVILILIVFSFTFVTMCGGNPQHDAYGFRHWKKPFNQYIATGSLGHFEGFLAALWLAVFTYAGPEYVGMIAGEAKQPRKTLKQAFKTIYWRFGIFFIGSALCVGTILSADDPALGDQHYGAGGSPYVIAMKNMGVEGLPHLVNALLLTSIFSAGNTYVYAATRTLYSLSVQGQAPRFLQKCTKSGVPVWALVITMISPALSFFNVSASTSVVITWFINITTASQILMYMGVCITYLCFYRAIKAQGISRRSLPYRGWGQPYLTWVALAFYFSVLCTYSYTMYLPGNWDIGSFFSYYTMGFVGILVFVGWKVYHQTSFVKPAEADLVWDKMVIDAYEEDAEPVTSCWRDARRFMQWRK